MLKNRLLSVGVLIFAAFVTIYVYTDGQPVLYRLIPLGFFVLTVSCCVVGAVRFLRIRTALIFALIPVFAYIYLALYTALFVPPPSVGFDDDVVGTVESVSPYFSSNGVVINVDYSAYGIPAGTKVKVYADLDAVYDIGDIVSAKGVFYSTAEKETLLASGIGYYTYAETAALGAGGGFISDLRRKISQACDSILPGDTAFFVKAITVGDASGIKPSDYAVYGATGVAHIFSVSGLHLSILVMAFYTLLKKFVSNRLILSASGLLFTFFTTALAGFSYSSLRAALMLALFIAGQAVRRNSDPFTSLFAALGVLLLLNPYSAASLSLQLSFLSTLGIITVNEIKPFKKLKFSPVLSVLDRYVAAPALFSVSSFIFTLPVILFSFGRVSLVSPIANIFAGLLFAPILVISYLFGAVALISAKLTAPLAFLLKNLIKLFYLGCKAMASVPFASLSTHSPYMYAACVAGVCAVVALLVFSKKRRAAVLCVSLTFVVLSVALCAASAYNSNVNGKCAVLYRDTVSGVSVYVASGRESLLIDYGGGSLCEDLAYIAGSTDCDALMFTRYNELTTKKAEYYLACMGTRRIYLKNPQSDDEINVFDEISGLANARGCDIIIFDETRFYVGETAVMTDGDAVDISAYGVKMILPLDNGTERFGADMSYDCVFLPNCFFSGRFSALVRTKYLIYGNKTKPEYAAGNAGRIVYDFYDAVALTVDKNGEIVVK